MLSSVVGHQQPADKIAIELLQKQNDQQLQKIKKLEQSQEQKSQKTQQTDELIRQINLQNTKI